jgi:hypothetical protein
MSRSEIRANLRIIRIEPWSWIRTGFLISLSIAVTTVTASVIMYGVLAGMGVLSSFDLLLGDLTGTEGALTETFTLPVVFLGSIAIAAFEVLVTTSLFALFGFIYNLTVPFSRGVEFTFAEDLLPSTQVAHLPEPDHN